MEEITLREFEEKYMHPKRKQWPYDLFAIRCKKCDSEDVEFAGEMEIGMGYYEGDIEVNGGIIIKCHRCGNATRMDRYDLEPR